VKPVLACFHCGEPSDVPTARQAVIGDSEVTLCCAGCEAAALLIAGAGLADYYRWRTAPAPRPDAMTADRFAPFDRDEVLAAQGRDPDGTVRLQLLIEGTRCAACSWLIEQRLGQLPGVRRLRLNPATSRGELALDTATTRISTALAAIADLGYTPHLLGQTDTLEVATRERRTALKRLVVAGFGMMQVMMIAVGLYAGSFHGIEPIVRTYLRVTSLIITTPVTAYAAWPIVRGALAGLIGGRVTMDLPVTLGILGAYLVSTVNTFTGHGEVYFDSVAMFVFLLLLARYVEMVARHQAGSTTDALARLLPPSATRLRADGGEEPVPLAALAPGDRVRVAAGQAFPADGILESGPADVDESLLTGEAAAVSKRTGDAVIAGAINLSAAATITVAATGAGTVLASIVGLLERAQSDRPRFARTADRIGALFLRYLLLVAAAVCAAWLIVDPARAFGATFAVLVVACPCALSLATPVAIAAATARLARDGMLVTRADALESLAVADRVVFDKTGTLTSGHPSLAGIETSGSLEAAECLALAAALETGAGHPLAAAFVEAGGSCTGLQPVTDQRVVAGAGVEGCVDGRRLRIGQSSFVAELSGPRPERFDDEGIHLGAEGRWLARFAIEDRPIAGAPAALRALADLGLLAEILSGDSEAGVARVARGLGIADFRARATPPQKLARIEALRAAGVRALVVGDGVNDAPCLGAAHVSVAIGAGSALAQSSADFVMVGHRLEQLAPAVRTARRTLIVIRQNLAWAALYNLVGLPAAALGYLPPWLAAIGMSVSSLIVVLNAARLMRTPRASSAGDTAPRPRPAALAT
jgi:P-type Cu2+ transporter